MDEGALHFHATIHPLSSNFSQSKMIHLHSGPYHKYLFTIRQYIANSDKKHPRNQMRNPEQVSSRIEPGLAESKSAVIIITLGNRIFIIAVSAIANPHFMRFFESINNKDGLSLDSLVRSSELLL
jgi:hypothetical protein